MDKFHFTELFESRRNLISKKKLELLQTGPLEIQQFIVRILPTSKKSELRLGLLAWCENFCFSIPYIETSAATGENVQLAVNLLLHRVMQRLKRYMRDIRYNYEDEVCHNLDHENASPN